MPLPPMSFRTCPVILNRHSHKAPSFPQSTVIPTKHRHSHKAPSFPRTRESSADGGRSGVPSPSPPLPPPLKGEIKRGYQGEGERPERRPGFPHSWGKCPKDKGGAHTPAKPKPTPVPTSPTVDRSAPAADCPPPNPIGTCGPGLIDLPAELRRHNIMNELGAFTDGSIHHTFHPENRLTLSRADISALAQAKAANYCGQNIVLETTDTPITDYTRLYLAGGFVNDINIQNAIDIGFIPNIDPTRIRRTRRGDPRDRPSPSRSEGDAGAKRTQGVAQGREAVMPPLPRHTFLPHKETFAKPPSLPQHPRRSRAGGNHQTQRPSRRAREPGRHRHLPFLRQQKGDAASEARRRGFIHSQHPRHSCTPLSSFPRRRETREVGQTGTRRLFCLLTTPIPSFAKDP